MNSPTSFPINYSNNAYFYADDSGVLGSFTKMPDARTQVTVDYSSLLAEPQYDGLTILSVSYLLNYGSAPQLIVSGSSIQGQNNILSFIVSGGLNGLKYILQINATLSDNQTINSQLLEVVVSAPGTTDSCDCPPSGRFASPLPISSVYQQASILNGDQTKFGSSFVVFWVSDQAPITANILDRWYNTQDGLIYDRATDGNTVFWVSSAQRPTQYITGPNPPMGPQVGDMWFNTSTNVLNIWMNTGSGNNWYVI